MDKAHFYVYLPKYRDVYKYRIIAYFML